VGSTSTTGSKYVQRTAQPDRANIRIPIPVAVAAVTLMILGGLALLLVSSGNNPFVEPTATITPSATSVPTFTAAPTKKPTNLPTSTSLPPVVHNVVEGDTCILIAVTYDVSVQSVLQLNGFTQACPLLVGQEVMVPVPTSIPAPTITATMMSLALTQLARPIHMVSAGESLSSIAAYYGVSFKAMAEVNGKLPPDYAISIGENLTVPVDMPLPTSGPTPTETSLPPYPAPNLLNPPDGQAISYIEQTVSLQWTSIVNLRENEVYLVTVQDVTSNRPKRIEDSTISTRYIINVDMKPAEAAPHVFKWSIVTARQTGFSSDGRPLYQPAGAASEERTFTWTGIGVLPTESLSGELNR
ncbi:MAG: LysM peptidoglycan-binding domain-containing protein, partial [Anaerolineales bacterium]|nr:LysM peptidoglycan-binding domain-containing protein [Anaerolineales bacterium]